jgi:hypothetical protein
MFGTNLFVQRSARIKGFSIRIAMPGYYLFVNIETLCGTLCTCSSGFVSTLVETCWNTRVLQTFSLRAHVTFRYVHFYL